jgi:hypothetical protein
VDGTVKIYLLSIDRQRFFFYADESEPPDDHSDGDESSREDHTGWKGWLLDRWHRLQSFWEHSESSAVHWTRRIWDWLHSWAHPDETMLLRLRSARRIELHHPASRAAAEVRSLWREYLNHRWWRHLLWMSVNVVVAPATWLLAILPGPNVIGYWFTYRALHHTLIVWGIRRVRSGRIELELRPVVELDWPIEHNEHGKATHAALDGNMPHLDEHVAWTESERKPPITSAVDADGGPPEKPAGTGVEEL